MTAEQTAEIRRAEETLTNRFKEPTSPVTVMREVVNHGIVSRNVARRVFADMLYMGRIRYSDPDHVVVSENYR